MKKEFFLRILGLVLLTLFSVSVAHASYTGSYTCANATGGELTTSTYVSGSSLKWTYTNATWSSPQTRFNANGNITFTASGIKVTKIVMGFSSTGYVGNWTASSGGTFKTSNTTVTWEGEGTNDFTFTTSAAARLKTLAFTYEEYTAGNEGGGDNGGGDENGGGETGGGDVTIPDNNGTNVIGTFTKVIGGTFEAGVYVIVGNSNNNALRNDNIASNWIYGTEEKYTNESITDPAKNIVWVVDGNGHIKSYDSNSYLYSSADKKIELSTTSSAWDFSYSSGNWTISTNYGSGTGTLRFNSTGWRPYTGSTGTAGFQIYKYTSNEGQPDAAPTITEQTATTEYTYVREATATALSVRATGKPSPSYQWYSNTPNDSTSGTAISEATSSSFTPSTATVGTTYYYCIASNSQGTAISNVFSVTVTPKQYTVTYNANGGAGSVVDSNSPYDEDSSTTVLANAFTKEGYNFTGWNTQANGNGTSYAEGDALTVNSNLTLYVQWAINTYTVEWKVNGQTWAPTETVNYNAKPTVPSAPSAADFDGTSVFVGWTSASSVNATVAPEVLFSTTDAAPQISDNVVFNAVFGMEVPSNDYEKINSVADLKEGDKYLIVGNSGSTYRALPVDKATVLTDVTPSSNKISEPAANLIWTLEKYDDKWRIKSLDNGKYLQISSSAISFVESTALAFSVSASSGVFTFTSTATSGNKVLSYYHNGNCFNAYTKPNNVYLYKASTTYSSFSISSSRSMTGITVDASDAKTEYAIGDRLDVSGVKVIVNFNDNSTETVTTGMTFAPANGTELTEAGTQTITVSYGGKTAAYDVMVKCRLSYNANGGEGDVTSELLAPSSSTIVLSGERLSRAHHLFSSWNTAADGSGTAYLPGESISISANTTLYAQWSINRYTLTYNANGMGCSGSMAQESYDALAWVEVKDNGFTREGYIFTGWNDQPDGSGESYPERSSFKIEGDITLYAQWEVRGENFTIFHESFGNNPNSARDWNDNYKEQSGVASVYANAVYAMTNARQSKNNQGSSKSGLVQGNSSAESSFVVGPLNMSAYADGTDVTLSYKWKAASVNGTYTTNVYYSTSANGPYTEMPNTAVGATTFVDVTVAVPAEALTSTTYFKVAFNTSNTQAVIDEFDLSGKMSRLTPTAYFDMPVHYVSAYEDMDLPEHRTVSEGVVTHTSDNAAVSISDNTLSAGAAGSKAIVTVTLAETDDHAGATASYMVVVAPTTIEFTAKDAYTPFSSEYHIDFTEFEDATAYVVCGFEDGKACLLPVNSVIPANTGIIIGAKANETIDLYVEKKAKPVENTNFLKAAMIGSTIPFSDENYVRFVLDGSVFKVVSKPAEGKHLAPETLSENTAYIEIPATHEAAALESMPLQTVDHETTGIENVAVDGEDEMMFNVWGQRVNSNYRGYIITKGQKRLAK